MVAVTAHGQGMRHRVVTLERDAVVQDLRLDAIELEQITQNGRLDTLELAPAGNPTLQVIDANGMTLGAFVGPVSTIALVALNARTPRGNLPELRVVQQKQVLTADRHVYYQSFDCNGTPLMQATPNATDPFLEQVGIDS
jgi:hypothetical protein